MEYQRKACSLLGYNFQIFNLWFGVKVFLSFHFESVEGNFVMVSVATTENILFFVFCQCFCRRRIVTFIKFLCFEKRQFFRAKSL
jgi:hypothetical protein